MSDRPVTDDIHELVCKEVDNKMKPLLIMISSEHEQTRQSFKRLEDLVIKKRLFYRKVVIGSILFVALILLG